MKSIVKVFITGIVLALSVHACEKPDKMEDVFKDPPRSYGAYTWWHWMNGNISKEGITKDLEAMAAAGLGGVQCFNVGGVAQGPVLYASEEWYELTNYAIKEAERLGLEFGMHNSPGFSSTGGYWVTPQQAMKQIVWTETVVNGGKVDIVLPEPERTLDSYWDDIVIAYPSLQDNAAENPLFRTQANYPQGRGLGAPSFQTPHGTETVSATDCINPEAVIDITANMDADGHLVWDAPSGTWTVIRMGYSPINRSQSAPPTSIGGLEIDKYSTKALDEYFDWLFPQIIDNLSHIAKKSGASLVIDSYEVGKSNWTPLMREEFLKRRGYDMKSYIPALLGKYVGSKETTERFLWDFRRTCADLFADNYTSHFADICHRYGIILYQESYMTSVFDEMQVGARADVPMAEFWVRTYQDRSKVKMASSIAHVNGSRLGKDQIVAAESFTGWYPDGAYQNYPFSLKSQGDDCFTLGLNRFIFHRFAHQSNTHVAPGMSMGNIGFHFDRTNTWFDKSSQWLKYVTRCQYLLQQGRIVSDVLYLLDEAVPVAHYPEWNPQLPSGYFGDAINADSFLRKIKVNGNVLEGPDNIEYRMLILKKTDSYLMSLPVLQKIHQFVSAGGILLGDAPLRTPGITSDADMAEFESLKDVLWGGMNDTGSKKVGRGAVFAGTDVKTALDAAGILPDVALSGAEDIPVGFIHREYEGSDIYFLANHRRTYETVVATFRVDGKRPELWNADTGETMPLDIYDVLPDGRVKVCLQFEPSGSWFVVFREPVSDDRIVKVEKEGTPVLVTEEFTRRKGGAFPDICNDFTISAWVRPEVASDIQSVTGRRPRMPWMPFMSSYPYYPGDADVNYGEGHAVAGINVSRSGIAVIEGDGKVLNAVASYDGMSGSWNHVVVTYSDGIPSLYLNGELKYTGKASGKIVHPAYKDVIQASELQFIEGDFEDYRIEGRPWTPQQVRKVFEQGRTGMTDKADPVRYSDNGLMFFENGVYSLHSSSGETAQITVTGLPQEKPLTQNTWDVYFPEGTGAPSEIRMTGLIPLQEHPDEGVRHFSGTAVYKTTFTLTQNELEDNRLFLDLGRVYVIASVKLNSHDLGILWKTPYEADITEVVKAGENVLEIEVANLWTNRLIGDAKKAGAGTDSGMHDIGLPEWYIKNEPKPDDGTFSYSVARFYDGTEPLFDSGIEGPVVIKYAKEN